MKPFFLLQEFVDMGQLLYVLSTGFQSVLMALYKAETKARGGRPVMINIPDLGHASLYHSPRQTAGSPQPVSPLSSANIHV
jgi:hypothetical protein